MQHASSKHGITTIVWASELNHHKQQQQRHIRSDDVLYRTLWSAENFVDDIVKRAEEKNETLKLLAAASSMREQVNSLSTKLEEARAEGLIVEFIEAKFNMFSDYARMTLQVVDTPSATVADRQVAKTLVEVAGRTTQALLSKAGSSMAKLVKLMSSPGGASGLKPELFNDVADDDAVTWAFSMNDHEGIKRLMAACGWVGDGAAAAAFASPAAAGETEQSKLVTAVSCLKDFLVQIGSLMAYVEAANLKMFSETVADQLQRKIDQGPGNGDGENEDEGGYTAIQPRLEHFAKAIAAFRLHTVSQRDSLAKLLDVQPDLIANFIVRVDTFLASPLGSFGVAKLPELERTVVPGTDVGREVLGAGDDAGNVNATFLPFGDSSTPALKKLAGITLDEARESVMLALADICQDLPECELLYAPRLGLLITLSGLQISVASHIIAFDDNLPQLEEASEGQVVR